MPGEPTFSDIPLGEPLTFTIERGHIEPGRTFSEASIKAVSAAMIEFMLSQVAQRWEQTNEPPTALTIKVQCTVS